MPATITHAYFTQDVYEILPNSFKSKLNINRLKMFGQSMDSLMFYNLFSIYPGKKIRDFNRYFHRNKTQEYFINMINYIKDNNLSDDVDVNSFLVGSICHFVLDSTIHPFIIYKTGVMDKKKPSTYKYNNVHEFMEVFLDNDMVRRRENTNPYKFNISKFCFDTRKFSDNLNNLIDNTFDVTFDLQNMSGIYYKSLKQMKSALHLFRRDPYGNKRNLYKIIDTFTSKKFFRFESISYYYPIKDRHNFLNSNHKLWRNPTTYGMTSNESFVDLYLKSIKIAKVMICASFDYIAGKEIELEKIFLNNSYVHGLDCNKEKGLKYFEF